MRGEYHRASLRRGRRERAPQPAPRFRVHPRGRFVQENHRGIADERDGDGEFPALSARQIRGDRPERRGAAQPRARRRARRRPRGVRGREPAKRTVKREVFQRGHRRL